MEQIFKENRLSEVSQPVLGEYVGKVTATEMLTHNVKRFTLEKPAGYTFKPGQATELSINLPGMQGERRPFTMTSLSSDEYLEFVIKIYTGHKGITEMLGNIRPGDELILHEVFGSLTYRGPGLFIAGGAGITPFIAIFRQLQAQNALTGCTLLFANRSVDDIILADELRQMLRERYRDILEISDNAAFPAAGFIDRPMLCQYIQPENYYYYICGPDKFVSIMTDHLSALGVSKPQIIIEE